jgi:hypothetical protein
VITYVITNGVVVCFYFTDVGGKACCGAGLECRYDRAKEFSVGVLVHGVGTSDVLVDESGGAYDDGHGGRVA